MKRPAQIIAATLNVLCPYCGEPQPSPYNDSDVWEPQEVRHEAGKSGNRTCNACDAEFKLNMFQKVTVGL